MQRITIALGSVATAVDYACHGLDAKIVIVVRGVARHRRPGDPRSPWRGYEVVTGQDTATTFRSICESCINSGGEDDEGRNAGFFMTVGVSPGAESLVIEIDNDSAYFTSDADNAFASVISKPLYGK